MPRYLMILAICLTIMFPVGIQAQSHLAEDYPGADKLGKAFVVNVSSILLTRGLQSYYRLHGRWPERWSDVAAAGFVQRNLLDYNLKSINPDDGIADSFGDVVYLPPVEKKGARYRTARDSQLMAFDDFSVSAPESTLSEFFAGYHDPAYASVAGETSRMAQIALAIELNGCLNDASMFLGSWPMSWEEFIASGFCPLTAEAVNPLNGEPVRMDGSSDDFIFVYTGTDTYVYATDASGGTPWRIR